MKYCIKCGAQIIDEALFCSECGAPQGERGTGNTEGTGSVMDSITEKINHLSGGSGVVRAPLGKIFSEVFKKHSNEEAEEIFACGTAKTTPKLTDVETAWPTPWLFGRIIIATILAFIPLYICAIKFGNDNAIPGLIVVGSFMVPVATMIFFFEFNVAKNISIFSVIKTFLVGGCASLLCAILLFDIFPPGDSNYGGAIIVSLVEEIAKALIVYYFIKQEKNARYLANGLLIGSAVGAGFAAFESAGYAFRYLISSGYETMMDVIVLRAALAIGGHVAWAAVSGFAIMLAKKDGPLTFDCLLRGEFWRLFIIPVILHAIWDMPIEFGSEFHLVPILLIIAIWIVLFVLLNNCLKQVANEINKQLQTEVQDVQ